MHDPSKTLSSLSIIKTEITWKSDKLKTNAFLKKKKKKY